MQPRGCLPFPRAIQRTTLVYSTNHIPISLPLLLILRTKLELASLDVLSMVSDVSQLS